MYSPHCLFRTCSTILPEPSHFLTSWLLARGLEFSPVIAETLHAQRHRVWYVRLYLLLPTAFFLFGEDLDVAGIHVVCLFHQCQSAGSSTENVGARKRERDIT